MAVYIPPGGIWPNGLPVPVPGDVDGNACKNCTVVGFFALDDGTILATELIGAGDCTRKQDCGPAGAGPEDLDLLEVGQNVANNRDPCGNPLEPTDARYLRPAPFAWALTCADTLAAFPVCPPGTIYDVNLERCVVQLPTYILCPPGTTFDPVTLRCNGSVPPPPTNGTCKPPGRIQLIDGVPVCMADPPIPSYLPSATPFAPLFAPLVIASSGRLVREDAINTRERIAIEKARAKWSASFLALDPTRRAGKPLLLKPCGCGGPDFEEVI